MKKEVPKVKPSQLADILEKCLLSRKNVMVTGAPGIGKSDSIGAAADRLNWELLIVHPVVDDPTDYKGLPGITGEGAEFLPFGNLRKMLDTKKDLVVFLDDLGQAPPAVQAACMQLLLAREINGKKISDKVVFIAATNRKQDRAGVSGILEPVKDRFFTIVELTPDADDWAMWALKNGIDVELVSFVKWKPDVLTAFEPTGDMSRTPTPRSIAQVNDIIGMGFDEELEQTMIAGCCGYGFAIEFQAYRKMYKSLPNIKSILDNPKEAEIPLEISIQYAVTMALINKANNDNFEKVILYTKRIGAEFATLAVKMATKLNPTLKDTIAYGEFILEF